MSRLTRYRRPWQWVQTACIQRYPGAMSRVIQIRDVPEDVHDDLTRAAAARGVSLTKYLVGELAHLAAQDRLARHNAQVIGRTRGQIASKVSRAQIVSALREG